MAKLKKTTLAVVVAFLQKMAFAQLVLTYSGTLQVAGDNDGPALLARFNNPHGIAVSPDGWAYVADRYNHTIRAIDPSGNVTTLAGQSGIKGKDDGQGASARFNEPWGICFGKDGFVYVADTRNNLIRRVALDGTVTTIAGSGQFGVADGQGLVTSWGNPTGIEQVADGTLYVAEHLTHTIRKITPDGKVTTIAGQPYVPGAADGIGNAARFYRPYGLAIDQNGYILVADEWNHRIRRIHPETRVVTTVAGNGLVGIKNGSAATATFNYPWDIVTDTSGNIYVADGYNYVMRKITPSGQVSTWCGSPLTSGGVDGVGLAASFSGATGIDYDPFQNLFYVADAYNHLVRRIVPNLGGTATIGALNAPPGGGQKWCVGDTIRLRAGPDGFETYRFYRNGQLAQQSPSFYFEYKLTETGFQKFKAEAVNGSEILTTDELTVEVAPLPDPFLSVIGETTIFDGDSVTLVASSGVKYRWSNGWSQPLLVVKAEGLFFATVTDANGCRGVTDSVLIEVIPVAVVPVILVGGGTVLCPGGSVELTSSYATGNQWLFGGFAIAGATERSLIVTKAGEYRVQIKDALGTVVSSAPTVVKLSAFKIADFSVSKAKPKVDEPVAFSATIDDGPAVSFVWKFGDGEISTIEEPSHTYSTDGLFAVELIAESADGCRDTLRKPNFIDVKKEDSEPEPSDSVGLWLPTAFSPNDDGSNDLFRPLGGDVAAFDLHIFNHWGELIFSKKDLDGWDGRCDNGLLAPPATYTYLVDVRDLKGKTRFQAGKITLLR